MRAIDTNIVVRCLINDDPREASRARAIVAGGPVFIPRTVVLETEWVLRSVYELEPNDIIAALRAFAGLETVTLEDSGMISTAMAWAEQGMGFADAIHLAATAGCDAFLTFDKRLVRLARRCGQHAVSMP